MTGYQQITHITLLVQLICANSAGVDGAAICDTDVRINRRFEESGGRIF